MMRLKDFVERFLTEEFNKSNQYENDLYLVEGIVCDPKTKTVKLNDSDEGVVFDSSHIETIDGIKVISIFKRTPLSNSESKYVSDGNPFVYALKDKGWKFDLSKGDVTKYLRKFIERCSELNEHYDTIISVPSKSRINSVFMDYIYDKVSATYKTDRCLGKLSSEEAFNTIDYEQIKKEYPNNYQDVINSIVESFERMGEDFEAKKIKKPYLHFIKYIVWNDHNDMNIAEQINGKKILVLDDVFSSGTTISQSIDVINNTFSPTSITVLTLLSRNLDKEHSNKN